MLTVDELAYQLSTTMATLLVVYPLSLETAIAAARIAGIASDRILLFGEVRMTGFPCMNELIDLGLRENPVFRERLLSRGEAKTKIALLSFSSGTTGKPKVLDSTNRFGAELNVLIVGCGDPSLLAYRQRDSDGGS
jgi:4-coumarate--CoA ligase